MNLQKIIAALACALLSSSALAQTAPPTSATGAKKAADAKPEDKKVDISDLENKYWAPKDTDFSVVQNRTYTKEHRWFLAGQAGMLVNDAYSKGQVYGLTGNYFFSERYGVQVSYQKSSLENSDAVSDLANFQHTGVFPNHDRLNNFYGVGFDFVPFYAKMSFMGKKVLYFDMAITPVIGMTNYDQIQDFGVTTKSAFTYGVDITQYIFFNNWFAIRGDLTNHWCTENVVTYENPAGAPAGTKTNQDTTFLLGLTFYY